MSDCTNCKDSILNNQSSSIPNPICQDDCPEDVGCDIQLASNCIYLNTGALDCLGLENGSTLNQFISAVENLCEQTVSGSNDFKLKVSASDTCGGYLFDKLTSSTLDIIKTPPSGCQILTIDEKSVVTNNITLQANWINGNTISVNYTQSTHSLKSGRVNLGGQIVYNGTAIQTIAFILPSSVRPPKTKIFTYLAMTPKPFGIGFNEWHVYIVLGTDGKFTANIVPQSPLITTQGVMISLDNFSYII